MYQDRGLNPQETSVPRLGTVVGFRVCDIPPVECRIVVKRVFLSLFYSISEEKGGAHN